MDLLKWKRKEMTYTSYEAGYLGEYVAFITQFDGMSNKHDSKKYKLRCKLNGIKEDLGNFESVKLAMERAESVLSVWMSKSGLIIK